MIRPAAVAATAALLLPLAACGPREKASGADDPYAGLSSEIVAWRTDIEASHPACRNKVDDKGCDTFQVTCKAAQEIAADERAKGVTAKVVAAMTFNGRTAGGASGTPGSAFREFSKAGEAWTHRDAKPVNLTTCAPL